MHFLNVQSWTWAHMYLSKSWVPRVNLLHSHGLVDLILCFFWRWFCSYNFIGYLAYVWHECHVLNGLRESGKATLRKDSTDQTFARDCKMWICFDCVFTWGQSYRLMISKQTPSTMLDIFMKFDTRPFCVVVPGIDMS